MGCSLKDLLEAMHSGKNGKRESGKHVRTAQLNDDDYDDDDLLKISILLYIHGKSVLNINNNRDLWM